MSSYEPASPFAKRAIEHALEVIRIKHEKVSSPARLFFHVTDHTTGVIARATSIMQALGVSEVQVTIGQTSAAMHDVIQLYRAPSEPDGKMIRQRLVGTNERESASYALQYVRQHRSAVGAFLQDYNHAILLEAIFVTVPKWDSEHQTMIQPALNQGSHPVTRAVALADLGSAGMDPQTFANEGPVLFAEDNIDIALTLAKTRSATELDEPTQAWYRRRLVSWLETQVAFVLGRRRMLHYELEGLSSEQQSAVKALFTGFEESYALAQEAPRKYAQMEFVELGRSLDPRAFPDDPK